MYRRESLPDSYSLMDVAYIYTWKRNGPMRFYYRLPEVIEKKVIRREARAESAPLASLPAVTKPVPESKVTTCKTKVSEKKLATEKSTPQARPKETKQPSSENITNVEQKAKENSLNASNITEETTKKESSKAEAAKVEAAVGARPLSKQDEISVSALLSLADLRAPTGQEQTFLAPPPPPQDKNGVRTTSGADIKKVPVVNGKIPNMKPSLNKIAADLAVTKTDPAVAAREQPPCPPPKPNSPKKSELTDKKPTENQPPEAKMTPRQPSQTEAVEGIKPPNASPNVRKNHIPLDNGGHLPISKPLSDRPVVLKPKHAEDAKTTLPQSLTLLTPQEKKPPITMRLSSTEVLSSSLFTKPAAPRPLQNGATKPSLPVFQPAPKSPFRTSVQAVAKPAANDKQTDAQGKLTEPKESSKPEIVLNTSDGSLTITGQPETKESAPQLAPTRPAATTTPPIPKPKNGPTQRVNGHSLTITVEPKTPPHSQETVGPVASIHHSNINNRMPTFQKTGVGRERKSAGNTPNGKPAGQTLDRRIQLLYNSQGAGKPGVHGLPQPGAQPRQPPPKQESRLANWLNNRFSAQPKQSGPCPDKQPQGQVKPVAKTPPPPPEKTPEPPKCEPAKSEADSKNETVQSSAAKLDREVTMLKRKLEELRKSSAEPICEITQENPDPEDAKRRRDVTPDVSIELMRASDMKKEFTVQSKDQMAGSSVKVKDKKRPVPGLKAIQEVEPKRKPEGEQPSSAPKKPKLGAGRKEAAAPGQTAALDLSKPVAPLPLGPPFVHDYRMALHNRAAAAAQQSNALRWLLANRPMLHPQFLPTGGK
ncbi:hypothetical protein AAG570_003623 [Ranatra chinensis]|uniref:RAWUL domain-containing protein n=1 Tax=Ranatra chinensis TaxID=642074 RepID=A0ABD0YM84_9HEMI